MTRDIFLKIYLCNYIEKEKTLASRHLVSSISICREHGYKSFDSSTFPEDLLRTLRLRGEVEVFDRSVSEKIFGIVLAKNQYLKLKIEEQ